MNHFMILALALAWLAILAGGWLGWQLLRQNGRLLLRLENLEQAFEELELGETGGPAGLPVGWLAPDFELPDLAGESRALAQYRGQPLLLIFFNPACGFCRDLLPKLAGVYGVRQQAKRDAALGAAAEIAVLGQAAVADGAVQTPSAPSFGGLAPQGLIVSTGDVESNRQLFDEHRLTCPVLLQKEMEVAAAYQANGTPSGYLIDAEGRIARELVVGAEAVLALLSGKPETRNLKPEIDHRLPTSAAITGNGRSGRFGNRSLAQSKIKRDGLKTGTPAPGFRLPRLDGRGDLGLEDFRGRRVLLVFSSPSCGPCLALAPQLEKFHREQPEVELLMISKGEPKENRAKVKEYGLTFPVVLQQQWEVSRRYAMFATPIAYLIDEAGFIARNVAVGSDAILALLADPRVQAAKEELAVH